MHKISRRSFAVSVAAGSAAPFLSRPLFAQAPFGESIEFARHDVTPKVRPFARTEVRLLGGVWQQAQDANLAYVKRLDAGRLVHDFRINAGLPSQAEPLGGWEKPDCELRGHFTGHYLSACALLYSSTGDKEVKARGDAIVADLAACQKKLNGGYLSAFPLTFFDRLNARGKVWAPFYTVHKIMAGMLDMSQMCDNRAGASGWYRGWRTGRDKWSGALTEAHMQDVLNTEYRRHERGTVQPGGGGDRGQSLCDRGGDRFRKSDSSIRWRCGETNSAGCT